MKQPLGAPFHSPEFLNAKPNISAADSQSPSFAIGTSPVGHSLEECLGSQGNALTLNAFALTLKAFALTHARKTAP